MTQLITPNGSPIKSGLSLRQFYIELTGIGEGFNWLIQPCNKGDDVWLFTVERGGRQLTFMISEDMFTMRSAHEVKQNVGRQFAAPVTPEKKFKTLQDTQVTAH